MDSRDFTTRSQTRWRGPETCGIPKVLFSMKRSEAAASEGKSFGRIFDSRMILKKGEGGSTGDIPGPSRASVRHKNEKPPENAVSAV
jgi:hypothetical protein